MFVKRLFNCAPADGGAGGAGGADKSGEGEAPKAITHEDVHGAISERLKRQEAKAQEREKALLDRLEALTATIEQLKTPAAPAEGGKGGKSEDAVAKAIKDAEDRFKSRLKVMEDERAAERSKAMVQEERSELAKALSKAGITDPVKQKAAVAVLYTEDKRISRDANGQIVFKGKDKYGDDTELPLEEGIGEWASTDEGKFYQPAKQVGGSGSRVPARQQRGQQPDPKASKTERGAQAMATIYAALRGGGTPQ